LRIRKGHIIAIIISVITIGIGLVSLRLYKKYKDTDKVKISDVVVIAEDIPKTWKDLQNILTKGFILKGYVILRNFSNHDYSLNQVSLDCYSPKSGKLIAEQTNIIGNDVIIKKKTTTKLPLQYTVDVLNTFPLFKECNIIPEDKSLWQIVSHPIKNWDSVDLNKLRIVMKGFIVVEGINITIDEPVALYG
jgi:hypothetical protein